MADLFISQIKANEAIKDSIYDKVISVVLLSRGAYSRLDVAKRFGINNRIILRLIDFCSSSDPEEIFSGVMRLFDEKDHPLKVLFALI